MSLNPSHQRIRCRSDTLAAINVSDHVDTTLHGSTSSILLGSTDNGDHHTHYQQSKGRFSKIPTTAAQCGAQSWVGEGRIPAPSTSAMGTNSRRRGMGLGLTIGIGGKPRSPPPDDATISPSYSYT
ncbi:unnamed protein product, partial [Sphacelaria rigidula]